MLAPSFVLTSVCRAAFSPVPSGEGSSAKLMVLAILFLAAAGAFAQTIPHITASLNTEGSEKITLNFTTEVSVNGSPSITISDEEDLLYTYNKDSLKVTSSGPLEPSSSELRLSNFKDEDDNPLSLEDGKSYVLKIPAGAFKDGLENETEEYPFNFDGDGGYYEASLNMYSYIIDKVYDGSSLRWNFELTNLSSYPITIDTVFWEEREDIECNTPTSCDDFKVVPIEFEIGIDEIEADSSKVFSVFLINNNNAGNYKANLVIRPSNGIQEFNVPVEINIARRQLTVNLSSKPKEYDGSANIELFVTPTNAAPDDEVNLIGTGVAYSWEKHLIGSYEYFVWDENPNVSKLKCVRDIKITWDYNEMDVINNYDLPPELENDALPTFSSGYCFIEAIITQAEWDENVPEVVATPGNFIYGDVSLDTILNDSWRFKSGSTVYNPHDLSINLDDEDFLEIWYFVEFPPPPDSLMYDRPEYSSMNYRPKQDEVLLTIHKRSLNNELDTAYIDAPCGGSNGHFIIKAKDPTATVVYEGIQSLQSLEFPVRLEYGGNGFNYSILSQAYERDNPNYRNELSYNFERFLPFEKVAYRIRGNTLTLDFNASDPLDRAFFSKYNFDFAKTEWYKGKELVYTGRNYSVQSSGDYSVIITGEDKETGNEVRFASCKESGVPPEVTPLTRPPTGGGIKLISSSFGSRMVPGGINLVLNTPKGGKVSVYTVAGEFITAMNAVDARTIVKLPNSHKMYIVKLEAQ